MAATDLPGRGFMLLQARIALEEVARLAPDLRLAEDADIHFGDNLSFRAPVEVPVTWPEPSDPTSDLEEVSR